MITELVLTVLGGAGLLAAGWGLALLWQRDDPPYDPLPSPRVWELPAPFEPGLTYQVPRPLSLNEGVGPNDVAPISHDSEEAIYPWPVEIGNVLASRAVKLKHNQWRCQ